MTWPGWRDWIFSGKTFAAAMLALYVALLFDLPRPYWAMTTVYVVANPLTGATVSKALYRTLGTLLGAAAAVVLVPLLVNARELLLLAVAAWAGGLLYVSMLHRTPRSYVFMLAGYTLPLIALPAVTAPATIFDLAVARSEEIIVGIVCASVVGAVILPMSLGPVVGARVGQWLDSATDWAGDILRQREVRPDTPLARQKLAAGIAELDMMISQLSYDAGARDVRHWAQALRGRLLLLLPVLSSLNDRLHALRRDGGSMPEELESLSREVADWLPRAKADDHAADRFRATITALEPRREQLHRWDSILHASLLARLRELVDLWQDCLTLHDKLMRRDDDTPWKPVLRHRPALNAARHYDHGMMMFCALSAVCASFTAGLLWIASGWVGGAYFMALTTVACCFFGTLDQPAVPMRTMVVFFGLSQLVAGIYVFGVFPRIHDFELLVLILAPPLIIGGSLLPRPERALMMMMLTVNSVATLAMQGRYNMDFEVFLNEGLAVIGGVSFALVWTLVTKPFGAEWAARRLIHAGWRDMANLAAGRSLHDHATLASRTVDRLGQLVPRLGDSDDNAGKVVDGLAELRVGYNILALQRDRRLLPAPLKPHLNGVLDGVANWYRQRLRNAPDEAAAGALIERIDQALTATVEWGQGGAARNTLEALVGLRRALFPHAAPPPDTIGDGALSLTG